MSSGRRCGSRFALAALVNLAAALAGSTEAWAQVAVRVTPAVSVSKMLLHGGDVWFETERGIYRSRHGEERAEPVLLASAEGATKLEPIGQDLWLIGQGKAHRVDRTSGALIEVYAAQNRHESIRLIHCSDSEWATVGGRFYRIEEGQFALIRGFDPSETPYLDWGSSCPTRAGQHFWTPTTRIDDDNVAHSIRFKKQKNPGAQRPGPVLTHNGHLSVDVGEATLGQVLAHNGDAWIFAWGAPVARVRGESLDAEPVRVGEHHLSGGWASGGEFGFWGNDGVYRIVGDDRAERLLKAAPSTSGVKEVLGVAWFHLDDGVYRIEGSSLQRYPITGGVPVEVSGIMEAAGKTWLTTSRGAYRVEPPGKYPKEDVPIASVVSVSGDDDAWFVGTGAIYRRNGPDAIKIWDEENGTAAAALAGSDSWKTISGSFFWCADPSSSQHRGWISQPTDVVDDGPLARAGLPLLQVLVQHYEGGAVYWTNVDHAPGQPPPMGVEHSARRVEAVEVINGHVWLATNQGAFRIDEDLRISVRLKNPLWRDVWTAGAAFAEASYEPQGKDRGFDAPDDEFSIIDEHKGKTPIPVHSYPFELRPWQLNQAIIVRDSLDNRYRTTVKARVIPGLAVPLGGLGGLWAIFVGLTLALAPFSPFFNKRLMSRSFRNFGSLGTIPLLLGLSPWLRRHVLRGYRRALAADPDFASLRDRYVVPSADFAPETFAARLTKQRRLLLVGQSGLGKTAYFRYLTALLAARKSGHLLDGAIPVFLPLGRYPGEEPEAMFHAQLQSYGQVTDPTLTAWLLRQGGFVIFIDGLNEVDDDARKRINSFVDQHWSLNRICLSSQVAYPLFAWSRAVELAALAPDTVAKVLEARLGKERADDARKAFTGDTYEICRIPQDLEYVIQLLEQGKSPPPSPHALYERIIEPVLAGWEEQGHGDAQEVLFRRAYEMLRDKAPWIERDDDPLPSSVPDDLVRAKLLVRVEGKQVRYHFRHDRIRAHLASRWFTPRWQTLLGSADANAIDSNWRGMLEFVILAIDEPAGVKDLVFALLEKNHAVARELFNWAERSRRELTETWAEDFKRRYGEALLRQAAVADNAVGRSALLNGRQYEQLSEALIAAFPDVAKLQHMLRFKLDKSLDEIALGNSLKDISFRVIGRAEAEGWTAQLVAAAREANPGNPLLSAFAQQLGLT
jgi:hypothetical protein